MCDLLEVVKWMLMLSQAQNKKCLVNLGLQLLCPTALSAEDPGPKAQQKLRSFQKYHYPSLEPRSGQQFMPTKIVKYFAAPWEKEFLNAFLFTHTTKLGSIQQKWVCAFSRTVNINSTHSVHAPWLGRYYSAAKSETKLNSLKEKYETVLIGNFFAVSQGLP